MLKNIFAIIAIIITFFAQPVFAGDEKTTTPDIKEIIKKAERGDANAQLELAIDYFVGGYIRQDDKKAFKWCERSADNGNVMAQYFVGVAYQKTIGVKKNYSEALKWYEKSFQNGLLKTKDFPPEKLKEAAERGNKGEQLLLGIAYSVGNGIEKDNVLSYKYLNLALAQGNDEIVEDALEKLKPKMTPEQIAQAEKLVREWKPTPSKPNAN